MTKGDISRDWKYILLFSVIAQESRLEFNCKARTTASEYI